VDGNILDLQAILEASVSRPEEAPEDAESLDSDEISEIEPVSAEQSFETAFSGGQSVDSETDENFDQVLAEDNVEPSKAVDNNSAEIEDEILAVSEPEPEFLNSTFKVQETAAGSDSPDPSELSMDGVSTSAASDETISESDDVAVEDSPEPEPEPETPADDLVVNGSADADVLTGDTGNDTLTGNGGDDDITGDDGDDLIYGDAAGFTADAGDDVISAGDGADTVYGSSGDDVIDGGAGDDFIDGGFDHDTITGGAGADVLKGYFGNDTISGDEGDDTILGEFGNDVLDGGAGNDSLDGSYNNDTLSGGSGDDTLSGGDGADTLTGGSGSDFLDGGDDDDIYVIGVDDLTGSDTLTDSEGYDILLFQSVDPWTEVSSVSQSGNDLIFQFNSGGSLEITDYYNGDIIERIEVDGDTYAVSTDFTGTGSFDDFITSNPDLVIVGTDGFVILISSVSHLPNGIKPLLSANLIIAFIVVYSFLIVVSLTSFLVCSLLHIP